MTLHGMFRLILQHFQFYFFFSLPSYSFLSLESIKYELISVFDQSHTLEMYTSAREPSRFCSLFAYLAGVRRVQLPRF